MTVRHADRSSWWADVTVRRVGVGLAVALVAWAVVESNGPLLQGRYMVFLAAAMLSSWYAGIVAGSAATVVSCVLLGSVVAPITTWEDGIRLGCFAVTALLLTSLNEQRARATKSEHDQLRATLNEAARALENERARFEAVLQQMPGGVLIVEAPSGKRIIENQRAHDILGFSIDLPSAAAAPELDAAFRQYPRVDRWPISRALQSGEAVHNEDMEGVRANGERIVLRVNAAPIRDAHGSTIAAVTTFEDVTELKAAEESLRFLQETSTTLAASLDFEHTLQSVMTLAVPHLADWCLLHTVNGDIARPRLTAAHVDATKTSLLEKLYIEYPVPADANHGYPFVLRTGQMEFVPNVPSNWAAHARDQTHADYLRQIDLGSMICLPLRVAGRTVGALTLANGTAKRRYSAADCRLAEHFGRRVATAVDNARLYGEIAEADRRKSEFLALMAHELRNPLAPMRNAVEILRLTDDPVTADQMRSLLERQLGYMARLVDDLVDLSRLERNKIALRRESVDLCMVVTRVIELHRDVLAKREQTLVESIPRESLILHADATRLEQLLSNLLDNAAKYTGAHGTIEVRVERLQDMAQVIVRDTGRGIRPEFLPHIFDAFRRGEEPGLAVSGGLGIGLTLVKRLVELHGGAVSARSAGIEQGSEFVVTFPLQPAAGPTRATVSTVEAAPVPRRLRALVCDDNTRAADTLGTLLELWGFDVEVVYDGRAAVDAASAGHPDVVLLDIALPDIDGYEVATRLRQIPDRDHLLIVAITGHGQDDDRRRSSAAGFDYHLVKPIDPPALHTLLREHAQHVGADVIHA